MAVKEDCIFCRIAAKSAPAFAVYEDEKTFAFLDVQPRAAGHTLLIPKFHAATIAALPESEMTPLFSAVKTVSVLLVKALGADGLTVGINQGRASGQVVDHLHVHILPRFNGDDGGAIQSVVNRPPTISLEELRNKILKK